MSKRSTKDSVAGIPFSVDASPTRNSDGWYLETKIAGSKGITRISIERLPFRIGRRRSLDLSLMQRSVSNDHAEIRLGAAAGELQVLDLGSTNGTFVNNVRILEGTIVEGDILHIADVEFRIGREQVGLGMHQRGNRPNTFPLGSRSQLPRDFVPGASKILDLIRGSRFVTLFQPIVRLSDAGVVAYEALARGRHPDLPEGPDELFRVAGELGLEPELSRLFRRKALQNFQPFLGEGAEPPALFFNTHPEEQLPSIVRSAGALHRVNRSLEIVFEIHEQALADVDAIRRLRDGLREHDVRMAFDDFGAGQARFVQLAEVPPDYLKFDIGFIRQIDRAPDSRRRLLESLVGAAHDLGVQTIAEGVETEAEASVCKEIGFTHAQGYWFGRPVLPTK